MEDSDCRFEYWEYHFSLLIKALLWSTQWESPIRLEAIEAELVAGRPEAALTLENSGAAGAARAEISLADACGTLEFEGSTEVSLAPGLQEIRLKLSADDVSLPLPGGAHLANVILRDAAGRVLTWGSVTLRVPEAVRIERIAFDRRAYSPGDVAKATVQIAGVEGPIPPVILRAEFIDALGRLLVTREHQTESGEGGTIPFELPVGQPLSTVATLRVTALSQGRPIAVSEADVITFPEKFARRAWADFEATVCGNHAGKYGRDYLIPLRSRLLKEYGVTTVRAGVRWRTDREYARQIRAGFQIMPLGVGYGSINIGHRVPKGKMSFKEQRANYDKTHDKAYLVRPVCLNSESDLAGNAARLREIAEYCAWLKPIGYNVGDEMSTTHYVTAFDYDFGAEALAAFRVWLREQYGSLAALNDQWDTAFAAWDDVMPLTTFEVKGRGNYAPWADHRAFMDYSFSAFLSWTRDRLRERDPEAALGISGSQAAEAYGGYDWSQLGRSLDFAVNYTHQNTIIMQRSLTPNVAWATPYWHVRNPATRHHFWWRLLNGCFGSSHFTYRFMFYPDLTPMPSTAEAAAVVQEFQSGVAKLLKNCTRISDIGIHYSQASIRGAFISGASSLFRENRMGWVQALEDSGFQGEFLAREQLESGELSARGYQAFVLPFSVAMSAKEGRALRRYVEDGGLLIADGKTGLMDERCKTRERGLLDDVFGIGRPEVDPLVAPREGEARFERNHGACELRDLGLDLSVAEQALTLAAGGEALGTHGKAPLAVVKKVGKGTAVFLNFFLDSLPHRRKLGMGKPMRELARNILLLDGVEPAIRVDVEADPPPHMFTVSYTSGAALYVASLMSHEGKTAGWTAPVSLTFPKAGYVYDIRGGLALGRVEGARLNLLAGEPALYGILPYRVSAVSVAPLTGVVTRGEPVRYEVAIQADAQQAGMHVIQAEVVDPGGVVRAHYSTRLLTRGGMATGEFVPALNDPTGLWTIRATDYVTRATGSAQLELRP